jgi:hypothetical protein
MARLSKHGTELLRISQEPTITDLTSSVDWRKVTRAYFSDGKILEKIDVHFKPDTFRPKGERYSYGWKHRFTVKKGLDPVTVANDKRALIAKGESKWVIDGDTAPAVVITQEQILRAVEQDYMGICKACGSEQEGVEPDACNYQCESCGMHEVYGAEEMLMAG